MCIKDIKKISRDTQEDLMVQQGGEEQKSIVIHEDQARRANPYKIPHSTYMRFYDLRKSSPRAHIRTPNREAISERRARRYIKQV